MPLIIYLYLFILGFSWDQIEDSHIIKHSVILMLTEKSHFFFLPVFYRVSILEDVSHLALKLWHRLKAILVYKYPSRKKKYSVTILKMSTFIIKETYSLYELFWFLCCTHIYKKIIVINSQVYDKVGLR